MTITLLQFQQIFADHEENLLRSALETSNFDVDNANNIILGQGF